MKSTNTLASINNTHILIVDDDIRILTLLSKFLISNNFLVSSTDNCYKAEILLKTFVFDLLILDVMLPKITGLEFASSIRSNNNKIPIVMLTALTNPSDKIAGLESGASDYVTKPFEPRELLLRINNLIDSYNQIKRQNNNVLFGNNEYDVNNKILKINNQIVDLTTTETDLLNMFITNPGNVFSREMISKLLNNSQIRSIDVQINRLRNKIEIDPKSPRYLRTVRNSGYVFYN